MKNDLKLLTQEVEKKIGKKIPHGADFEKLAMLFSVKHHLKISAQGLHKVWNLEGEDDGNLSYDTDEDHELSASSDDDID